MLTGQILKCTQFWGAWGGGSQFFLHSKGQCKLRLHGGAKLCLRVGPEITYAQGRVKFIFKIFLNWTGKEMKINHTHPELRKGRLICSKRLHPQNTAANPH